MQYLLNNFAGPLGVLLASILYPHPQKRVSANGRILTARILARTDSFTSAFNSQITFLLLSTAKYAQNNSFHNIFVDFLGVLSANVPYSRPSMEFVRIRSALRRQRSSTCASLLPVKKKRRKKDRKDSERWMQCVHSPTQKNSHQDNHFCSSSWDSSGHWPQGQRARHLLKVPDSLTIVLSNSYGVYVDILGLNVCGSMQPLSCMMMARHLLTTVTVSDHRIAIFLLYCQWLGKPSTLGMISEARSFSGSIAFPPGPTHS